MPVTIATTTIIVMSRAQNRAVTAGSIINPTASKVPSA